MPFIVRCPHCRKYMLIEDEFRGSTGQCLLCKAPVLFDASQADRPKGSKTPSGEVPGKQATTDSTASKSAIAPAARPAPPKPAPPAIAPPSPPPVAAPAEAETEIRVCPTCQTKMRVPLAARGKRVRCPKCQGAFQ